LVGYFYRIKRRWISLVGYFYRHQKQFKWSKKIRSGDFPGLLVPRINNFVVQMILLEYFRKSGGTKSLFVSFLFIGSLFHLKFTVERRNFFLLVSFCIFRSHLIYMSHLSCSKLVNGLAGPFCRSLFVYLGLF